MAVDLLCCGIIHRCRAGMRRPQASQLAAGRRTGVPVSSQGMQWKRHLKAKCREQVPNLPLPRARGTCRVRLDITQVVFLTIPASQSGWQHVPHLHSRCLPDFLPIPALAGRRYNCYGDLGQASSHRHGA